MRLWGLGGITRLTSPEGLGCRFLQGTGSESEDLLHVFSQWTVGEPGLYCQEASGEEGLILWLVQGVP